MPVEADSQFTYNPSLSPEANFTEWLFLANEEREMFKEPPLTRDEGKVVFDILVKDFL